jgi:hypothetical protein
VHNNFIQVCPIDGKINLADIFTKEMKDVTHFIELRDRIMCLRIVLSPECSRI